MFISYYYQLNTYYFYISILYDQSCINYLLFTLPKGFHCISNFKYKIGFRLVIKGKLRAKPRANSVCSKYAEYC